MWDDKWYPVKCTHAESANPRTENWCVKCGKRMPDIGPVKPFTPNLPQDNFVPKDPARDPEFESAFLQDALEVAQRLAGIANPAYPHRVNHRLDVGRARYGDADFLSKDNLVEVLEETPDLAAYAMLELQRLRHLGVISQRVAEELRLDLVAVAAFGAVADWYAQRAARRLKGTE